MAKRIERAKIESGKAELPKKLQFLQTEKLDFTAVIDRDGEFSVEMPVAALSRLAKARGDLKTLKTDQKAAVAAVQAELASERTAHEATQAEVAKLTRQLKAAQKKLDAAAAPAATPASTAAPSSAVAKPAADKVVKADKAEKTAKPAVKAPLKTAAKSAEKKVAAKKAAPAQDAKPAAEPSAASSDTPQVPAALVNGAGTDGAQQPAVH